MCRGSPAISSASSHSSFQSGALLRPANPGSWSNSSASPPDRRSASFATCSISPGGRSSALPISRTVERRREVGGDLAGEVEQIVIDEEEPAEPVALDEPQLLGEPPLRLAAMQGVDRIALFEPRAAQLGERAGGGSALGAVEVGKAISQIPREIELTAPLREDQSIGDSIWTVTKQRFDLFRRAQEELAVAMTHVVRAVERRAVPDSHQHVVQPMPLAPVVVHVARRYDAKSCGIGDVFQRSSEGEVSPDVVPLQLDDKVLLSEHRTAPLGEAAGSGQPVAPQHAG